MKNNWSTNEKDDFHVVHRLQLFQTINGKIKIKYGCRNGQETTEISHKKDIEVFGIDIMRTIDKEYESNKNPH